jgi:twitching motility protein PilT
MDFTDLDRFINAVWHAKGTDLLLTSASKPFIRVEGSLRRLEDEPELDDAMIHGVLASVLSPEQVAHHASRDVDFAISWREQARLRGSAFRQRGGPALALRLIPDRIPTPDELGLPSAVRAMASLRQGLVLFTGPTGSGKSTSQASLIDSINSTKARHILTIEEPLEYLHRHKLSAVNQREIGTDADSFPSALRSALREDPDIVLVGEMRDLESIHIALTLAETGHLVISTLHTNDASQALDRIVDVFPSDGQAQIRVQLAGCLAGVVAQRLLPRKGGGLVAAFEILTASHAIRNLVREGKTRQIRNVISTSRGEGMQTLEHGLSDLVKQGAITPEDALAAALVPGEVELPRR